MSERTEYEPRTFPKGYGVSTSLLATVHCASAPFTFSRVQAQPRVRTACGSYIFPSWVHEPGSVRPSQRCGSCARALLTESRSTR